MGNKRMAIKIQKHVFLFLQSGNFIASISYTNATFTKYTRSCHLIPPIQCVPNWGSKRTEHNFKTVTAATPLLYNVKWTTVTNSSLALYSIIVVSFEDIKLMNNFYDNAKSYWEQFLPISKQTIDAFSTVKPGPLCCIRLNDIRCKKRLLFDWFQFILSFITS